MIHWLNKQEEAWEGTFRSEFFRNEDNQNELFVCAEAPVDTDYAEKAIENFNALPEDVIQEICKGIVRLAGQGGINEDFTLPELSVPEEILEYCWFTTLYINVQENGEIILEGEGEWEEVIGIVLKNNQIVYIGTEYFDYDSES